MGFFPLRLAETKDTISRSPTTCHRVCSLGEKLQSIYTRGVFAKPRNNRRSSKPRVQVLPAGEEVARKRSEGKKHASNGGRESREWRERRRRREKEEDDENREEKVSTSRATFIPFTSLPAQAIDEEQRGRPRRREGRAHESKTVAVYGRFYGVTHRGTTVLLLSILAIEIGCLLIGICLSREPLMIPWVGRAWRRALHIAPTFTRDTMELVHAAALHRAVRTNRVFNTFGTAQDRK